MENKTYLVFHIIGFEQKDQLGNYIDRVVLRLVGTSYEEALERAKKIVEKPNWILGEVVEYFKEN